MLAIELKNYLRGVSDDTNILIFARDTGEVRQLLLSDLNRDTDGHIVINAEYEITPKHTIISEDK